jgi:hypothetical protein
VVKIPVWFWKKTGGRLIGSKVEPLMLDESGADGDDAVLGATAANTAGEGKKRRAKARQRS